MKKHNINKLRQNVPSKKPRVSSKFIAAYPELAARSYGVTAERLARVVNNIGLTALHYALRWSPNVPEIRFKHLLQAEKNMVKSIERGPNFHAFYQSTPLEVAVRYGKLPPDTTKEMLQKVKTRHGTGWDSVITRLKCKVLQTKCEVGEERFHVARTFLEKFHELINCLRPLRREYHALLLAENGELTIICRKNWHSQSPKEMLVFLLQAHPKSGLAALDHYGTLTERLGLLTLLLQGKLPAVPDLGLAAVQERRLAAAKQFAEQIATYPELATHLNPDDPFHEKIIAELLNLKLTMEQRSALATHPALCAALL